ncbi:hypothetical protein AWC25_11485 [Mycobacterium sherrisii]|uniref:Uncharacterized protein n=1 Tax=Mycobacterium sherrisii TaxID=243061 RepID=A0A1E3SWP5_9MYCO|nr:hypothetical protein [Mycobacterium sherrisii]MCV7031980.1 hypothetical protein [Mycobacterium sherrisii]ODR06083.1 hypothetical protein BHQ21_12680 [Mycobacterium sherrisii]ORW76751.1 hypothetical protein AWC25_11485 [Mycobacterium sherrisii]
MENVHVYAELEHRVRDRTAAPQQANEEIRQLAVTDAMTGLTDRRCFYLLPSKSYGGHITTALSACRQPSAWCGAGARSGRNRGRIAHPGRRVDVRRKQDQRQYPCMNRRYANPRAAQ